MNVFACDPCPKESAIQLADRHVVKMVCETAQILSTVCYSKGIRTNRLYHATHTNHPIVLSCISNVDYLAWVALHGQALGNEYLCRFDKHHASSLVVDIATRLLEQTKYDYSKIVFPQVIPLEFQGEDPHAAYQACLIYKYKSWGKRARWTRAAQPIWLPDELYNLVEGK
jgi:hypothetical protein